MTIIFSLTIILILVTSMIIGERYKGQLIDQVDSPDGRYTLNIYYKEIHSTVNPSIRCDLHYNKTHKKARTIYNQYPEDEVDVIWLDEHRVQINDKILQVETDIYDWKEDE